MMLAVPFVGLMVMMISVPPGVSNTSLASGSKVFVVFSVMLKKSRLACGGTLVAVVAPTLPDAGATVVPLLSMALLA